MTVNEKMSLVIALAEKALEKNELPIACIIFHNDAIIAQSYTSEIEDKRLLVHAELKALMELDQKRISAKEKKANGIVYKFRALYDVLGCIDSIIYRQYILFACCAFGRRS